MVIAFTTEDTEEKQRTENIFQKQNKFPVFFLCVLCGEGFVLRTGYWREHGN